jgi:ribosomal protein S1
MSKDRIEKPEEHFAVDQEVRVKIVKMDVADKKIGLSIKAALDEPDDSSLSAYQQSQEGDGSATLGDLVGEDGFRRGSTREDDERSDR